jgi:UDP-N-acetylmuramate-alanine ligase
MPRIIHDNSHHSGREFLVVIKDEYEPTLNRNTEPREIVLVNTIEGHFTIHRNGLIVKEQFCDQVLNCKKRTMTKFS